MKVLHISTIDYGGAGSCAYRIHKSMIALGIDSKMLVLNKKRIDETVIAPYRLRYFLHRSIHKVLRLLHLYICDSDKLIKQSIEHHSTYTSPVGIIDISKHPLLQWADIIHLHWVDMFVDQPKFFENVEKPIVWTLHDEGLFHGTSHYHDSVLDDDPLELKYRAIKFRMVQSAHNLGVVLLSKYFLETFQKEPILKNVRTTVINNSVDYNLFKPIDKKTARKNNNISEDAIVLFFISTLLTDRRKGLDILINSVEQINNDKMKILAIGEDRNFNTNPHVICTGPISETRKLSELISAADYYAMPSLQEAFSQAPLEAMSCGIPAIVFPVSGTEELITKENGIRCNGFTAEDMADGIRNACSRIYNPDKIRDDVIKRFSPNRIAEQYLEFYKNLLGE